MNREIVIPGGAGVYPLNGDVQSTAGSPTVRVIGLQGIPVANTAPSAGSALMFNQNDNQWEPILEAQIQINGITVSDDPWVSVNAVKPIQINGA